MKRLRGVVGKRSAAGAAGHAGRAGSGAGCGAGSEAGFMAARSYMPGAGGALLCGGGPRSSPGMFFWTDAGARGAAAGARRLRGGLGEPQRLRRLRGWWYLGWFRHGIFGESRGGGGGEGCAPSGVSGVRVAGAGAVDLLATGLRVVSGGYVGWDY